MEPPWVGVMRNVLFSNSGRRQEKSGHRGECLPLDQVYDPEGKKVK
jgi:hypothetical protein